MKIKMDIEIDATPEELRECVGLPDVKCVQDRIIAKMEEKASEFTESFNPKVFGLVETIDTMKAWTKTWSDFLPKGGGMI